MPTILRRGGFEFVIRTRDHDPPHVHVFLAGTEVLFNLGIESEMPTIREVRGMNQRNVRRAFEIVIENNEIFLARWREIYG
ncbi:MAG TPA: DUF4160 domain-containing protein [Pyrinomonadaceae bacterium]|nr:DUF4160 domain-containing protein [Pyrinomonadaceae bacterium]